jgi:hypothetical protein
MNKEDVKKALNHFENDEFTDAKEILRKGIKNKRNEFLNAKLGLKEDSTEDAKKTLQAILNSSTGEVKKMAQGMMDSYKKNKGFSKDQANWIYKTSQAIFK